MKRQVQNIIIASVILALLLGIFFLVVSFPSNEEPDNSNSKISNSFAPFLENNIDKISSVSIENTFGKFTIELASQDGNKTYNIKNLEPNKASSQSSLQVFMSELTNISPIQTVESNTNDLKKYGLEMESAKITVSFTDNTAKTFKLGNEAPLSIGYYLRINDENTVYLISLSNAEIFLNNKNFYIEDIKP